MADLKNTSALFQKSQQHNYSVVMVLARLLARGLVLTGTGASAPRRCIISGTSTKMLESRSLIDDC